MKQKIAQFDINPLIIRDKKILLAKRIEGVQFGGCWHLPGGKVLAQEKFIDCLKRISILKTGLNIDYLFKDINESVVGVYDDPNRDPREHVAGITFFCKVISGDIIVGNNCSEVKFFPPEEIQSLETAFGHDYMIKDGLIKLKKIALL